MKYLLDLVIEVWGSKDQPFDNIFGENISCYDIIIILRDDLQKFTIFLYI